ncbi:MAG: TerB family tellurite resistance protein [Phycisphaeraceae bacterium]|nr:TerB family tellurite resistance protein [Phycisphaeraceae bacterium]
MLQPIASSGPLPSTRASDLARALGIEDRDRYTPTQCARVAEAAQGAGVELEPDPRLTGVAWRAEEHVALLRPLSDGHADPERYRAASCVLRLGAAVAAADGPPDADELRLLSEHLARSFDLNAHERRRIESLRSLLVEHASDVQDVGPSLRKSLSDAQRSAVLDLLVAIAGVDGILHESEQSLLKRCTRLLGLRVADLAEVLKRVIPTTTQDRSPAESPESQAADTVEPLTLDPVAIERIMHSSREVSILLAQAMVGEEESKPQAPTHASHPLGPEALAAPATPDGPEPPGPPPPRYATLLAELSQRDRWTRHEAESRARTHGLMLSGAVEAINDWAFERFGRPVVFEEDDAVIVDRDALPVD